MKIESILAPERTCCSLEAGSKKRAIEEVAKFIAASTEDLTADDVYERLIGREKMGTTAIGHGIAIPHCRIDACGEIIGGLFRLNAPIDFGAFDEEPVNLMFVLLVPAEEVDDHLKTLALLARQFESETYRNNLLHAHGDLELYEQAIAELPLSNTA